LPRTPLIEFFALVNSCNCLILIDNGSTDSFISQSFALKSKVISVEDYDKCQKHTVKLANGSITYTSRQKYTISFEFGNCKFAFRCSILDSNGPFDAILGADWLKASDSIISYKANQLLFENPNITKRQSQISNRFELSNFNIITPKSDNAILVPGLDNPHYNDLVKEFDEVFAESLPYGRPPPRDLEHEINLKEGARPFAGPYYRLAPIEREVVRKTCEDLKSQGKIRDSNSPHAAPTFVVSKKDGDFRMVCDYRMLNLNTELDKYSMPHVDVLIDQLQGAKIFTLLDLRSGFHQIPIRESDISKTAFRTMEGHFEWLVMPFGLTNAPSTHQRLLDRILKPVLYKSAICYIDDILIYSMDEESHKRDVKRVLQILHDNQLVVKTKKCSFGQENVIYLGHKISTQGISPDPCKLDAIRKWPIPTTIRELQQFLGMTTYLRRFIAGYSNLTAELTNLIRKETKWVWTDKHQSQFDKLKKCLCEAPVLRLPDASRHYTLAADASTNALGAVLFQPDDDGHLHPVAYHSRKLKKAERNYATHDLEMLAIYDSITHWRHYLFGSKFTVWSDHITLQYFAKQPKLNKRQIRWSEELTPFKFDIIYKPGKQNIIPDALSRTPMINAISFVEITDDFDKQLPAWLSEDAYFGKILKEMTNPGSTEFKNSPQYLKKFDINPQGHLYYTTEEDRRLCIPLPGNWRKKLIEEHHCTDISSHVGGDKTLHLLQSRFYWPELRQNVRKFIQECHVCQANKHSNKLKAGLAQPLQISTGPWDSVSMDFVSGIPKSRTGKDQIFVIVDRFTKRARFVPCFKTDTAVEIADIFFTEIVRQHGIPRDIVSDRDARFTSIFWTSLFRCTGTKLNMSSAYHPESDGQTERVNKDLGNMLRCQIMEKPGCWESRIASSEFAYNSTIHTATGITPFLADTGREFRRPSDWLNDRKSNKPTILNEFLDKHKALITRTRDKLHEAARKQELSTNKHRRALTFRVNDEVWLDTRHLQHTQFKNENNKLSPLRTGPFKITRIHGSNYQLKLPKTWRIANSFHVSLLTPFIKGDKPTPDLNYPPPTDPTQYRLIPNKILAKKIDRQGHIDYLVQHEGENENDAIWLPIEEVRQYPAMINDFKP
jgi:RNase H-like domain found in reverse transcriptase/Reverse transcriptase (RNA-dependent DNA polymerase)/Integrase zinc binding domain/Retroviral aspartyl protease